jgi:hypothetical protein
MTYATSDAQSEAVKIFRELLSVPEGEVLAEDYWATLFKVS